jgi:hypothetical protein
MSRFRRRCPLSWRSSVLVVTSSPTTNQSSKARKFSCTYCHCGMSCGIKWKNSNSPSHSKSCSHWNSGVSDTHLIRVATVPSERSQRAVRPTTSIDNHFALQLERRMVGPQTVRTLKCAPQPQSILNTQESPATLPRSLRPRVCSSLTTSKELRTHHSRTDAFAG